MNQTPTRHVFRAFLTFSTIPGITFVISSVSPSPRLYIFFASTAIIFSTPAATLGKERIEKK